jgi:hypothetical protein
LRVPAATSTAVAIRSTQPFVVSTELFISHPTRRGRQTRAAPESLLKPKL